MSKDDIYMRLFSGVTSVWACELKFYGKHRILVVGFAV
jgi:hypothetical protein